MFYAWNFNTDHTQCMLTLPKVIAVCWAAMFVPFLAFLKPSIPALCSDSTLSPFVKVIIVLLGLDFILTMCNSLYGTPLKSRFGVSASGNRCSLKHNKHKGHFLHKQKRLQRKIIKYIFKWHTTVVKIFLSTQPRQYRLKFI